MSSVPAGPSAEDERREVLALGWMSAVVADLEKGASPPADILDWFQRALATIKVLASRAPAGPTKAELVALDGAIALVRDEGIRRRTADPKSAQHWFGVEIELASLGAKLAGTEVVVDASRAPAGEPEKIAQLAQAALDKLERIGTDADYIIAFYKRTGERKIDEDIGDVVLLVGEIRDALLAAAPAPDQGTLIGDGLLLMKDGSLRPTIPEPEHRSLGASDGRAPSEEAIAWLIEAAGSRYYAGVEWTTDHWKAIRYVRREDAHRAIMGLPHGWHLIGRAVEHGWAAP